MSLVWLFRNIVGHHGSSHFGICFILLVVYTEYGWDPPVRFHFLIFTNLVKVFLLSKQQILRTKHTVVYNIDWIFTSEKIFFLWNAVVYIKDYISICYVFYLTERKIMFLGRHHFAQISHNVFLWNFILQTIFSKHKNFLV